MDTRKIEKISASGILHRYDYDIDFTKGNTNIKAIYAENGCGKTNLLRLVHCIISGSVKELQKIFSVHFQKVEIKFFNGIINCANIGYKTYNIIALDKTKGRILNENISIGDLKDFSNPELSNEIQDKYENIVANISYIIGGQSTFLGTNRLNDVDENSRYASRFRIKPEGIDTTDLEYSSSGSIIESVLYELSNSLVRNVQRATIISRSGMGVYYQITKDIIGNNILSRADNPQWAKEVILDKIKEIDEKKGLVEEYKLINLDEFNSIKRIFKSKKIDDDQMVSLQPVLIPYFDSLKGRIEDLEPAATLIESFIESINKMFRDKKIEYSLQGGFNIYWNSSLPYKDVESDPIERVRWRRLKRSMHINPARLSSGEKHLLLLLSKVIISSTKGDSLLIIDEPEISLGIQWQRLFVKYVQECAYESNLQIVMATHSPLILEDYDDIDISVPKRESRN